MMKMALAVLSGIVLFLLVLPLLLALAANGIGMALGLPPWPSAPFHLLGFPLAALGLFLVAWSGYALITRGRGTPLPLMPTERLVITGPYALCRNPMVLGELPPGCLRGSGGSWRGQEMPVWVRVAIRLSLIHISEPTRPY